MAEQTHGSLAAANEVELIAQIIRARQSRTILFRGILFADPAWDMMLELYLAALEARRLAISELGIKANVPLTTSLRWIETLEEGGWVRRVPDEYDRRRFFIELSDRGAMTMAVWVRLAQPTVENVGRRNLA
jgi:DNA-binding MarR family transcriptional regulator